MDDRRTAVGLDPDLDLLVDLREQGVGARRLQYALDREEPEAGDDPVDLRLAPDAAADWSSQASARAPAPALRAAAVEMDVELALDRFWEFDSQ